MTDRSRPRRRTYATLVAILVVVLAPAVGGAVGDRFASSTASTDLVASLIDDNMTDVSVTETVTVTPIGNVTAPGGSTGTNGSGGKPGDVGDGTGPPNGTVGVGPPNGTVGVGPPNGTVGVGPPNGTVGADPPGQGPSGTNAQPGGNVSPGVGPWKTPPTGNASVNVTVKNAPANATVPVDVPAVEKAAIGFDALDVEVEKGGTFTLNVSTAPTPQAAPELSRANATLPLGYVHLEHSIPDEDVGNVTITFRVNESLVAAANATAENVALFRFSGGDWTELPTELLGRDDGAYVYRAESPGLSEFATGAKRPAFEIPLAAVDLASITVGETVAVRVQITNVGSADGVYTAKLSLDDEEVDRRDVSVAASGTRVVTFRQAVESPGTYTVSINDVRAGEVAVEPAATTASGTTSGPEETGVTPAGGQPGFGPAVALLALVVGALFERSRKH